MKMKCVQLTGFRTALEQVERPMPEVAGTEVLLKVLGAGMCHSDVHIWEGVTDLGGGRSISMEAKYKFPLILGHETTGEVVKAGPQAVGAAPGGRYLVCSWVGCGQCVFCRQGDEHLCTAPQFLGINRDGGYSDHIVVPHPRYLIDLKQLDPIASAPLACSGLTTYCALKRAGPMLKEQLSVIIGAGGLGLMALNILRMLGGKGAVVVEIDPKKREAALAAGAVAVVDPKAAGASKQIRAAVSGPILFVLDLVGSGETAALGFDLLDRAGKLVVVGLAGGSMQLSVALVPGKAASIQGSFIGSPSELRELVELVQQTQAPVVPIDRRSLSDANQAFDDLRHGKIVGRVVLVP